MSALFLLAFNMSIAASYFILAIVVFRLIFRKAPKWVNCILWALVGLRLAIPFSIESDLSLLPTSHTVITDRESSGLPFSVDSGIYTVDENVNGYLKAHYYEGITVPENAFVDTMFILSVIWLIGVAVMLIYSAISFIRLKKRVSVSLLYRDNIYYCDNIETPFILGTIRPKIYIPSGLEEAQIENVVMHEKAHLKRKDHWWKPLGFLILSFYWFNPVIWVAYILLCRDIEKACDEKVIKNMNTEEKKGYLETLLDCSVQRKMILACPVAFGEVGIKQRVKAVLNYKKPAFWVIIMAVIVTVAVSVGFLTNPKENYTMTDFFEFVNKPRATAKEKEELKEKYPHFFDLECSGGLTAYVTKLSEDNYKWYLSSNENPTDPQNVLKFSEFADTEEMGKILYTYDIGGSGIEIVPIQHSLSSFWWENPEEEADSLRESLGFIAKEVWCDVDARFYNSISAPYSNENEFFKDMNQYEAKINPKSGELGYSLVFTESQYHKLITDKYNQVASIYNSFEQDNEHSIFKNVEFDKDFRKLKIYIDKELYEVTSSVQMPGVIRNAYAYQMFLDEGGIGVNAEIIDYKTNKVLETYEYPEDDWMLQDKYE